MSARSFFSKPKDKKPAIALVGGDQGARAAALTAASQASALFDDAAAQVGVDEPAAISSIA
jgi:hypothetical protein